MRFRTLTLTAGALATVLVLAGCAPTDGTMPGMDHGPGGMTGAGPPQSAAAFNAADEMFVTMMIPHHQQAIEMADQILAKDGIDERVVSLAEQIKAAQDPEIQTMKGWLEEWGVPYDDSMSGMDGMDMGGGMMSEDDMAALDAATGVEATRVPERHDRSPPGRRDDGAVGAHRRTEPGRGRPRAADHRRADRRDHHDAGHPRQPLTRYPRTGPAAPDAGPVRGPPRPLCGHRYPAYPHGKDLRS